MRMLISIVKSLACVFALSCAIHAHACWSPASFKAVVHSASPTKSPDGAQLFHIRIEEGLRYDKTSDVLGFRGTILDRDDGSASQFTFTGRVRSPCRAWVDIWTKDHEVKDGVLSGYIAALPVSRSGDMIFLRPYFYQSKQYRTENSTLALVKDLEPKYLEASTWKQVKFNLPNNPADAVSNGGDSDKND